MDREFDIIVHGASGFTARHVVKLLMETKLKIALSGRSEERIKLNVGFSSNASALPILVTTAQNMGEATVRARVVLNCAGPFVHCGEEVVKACVATGTHYVDVTGEPYFVEDMISKYDEEARKKKVLVVPCCGYDSIPADVGVMFLKKLLGRKPVWARSYMQAEDSYINVGTYNTVVHSLANLDGLRELRRKNRREERDGAGPSVEPVEKDKLRKIPFYSSLTGTYCALFPGSDASVVKRSQKLLSGRGLGEPLQYGAYVSLGGLFSLLSFLCFAAVFFLVSRLDCGRKLLLKYPGFFSFGRVLRSGPTDDMISKSKFRFLFEGEGVTEEGKRTEVTAEVSGPDPGYVTTPVCVVVCAELLLDLVKGDWKPTFEGGLLTPATAFHGTDIVDRLVKRGLKFEEVGRRTV